MDNKKLLGRLAVAGVVNFVVVAVLEDFNPRLARLYTFVLAIITIVTFRNELFPAINTLLGTIKGGLE